MNQPFASQTPQPTYTDSVWVHRKTVVLTSLLGSIPLSIGNILRCWAYRSIIGDLGKGAYLGTGLEIVGARGVFIEPNAALNRSVHLDTGQPNGRIILRSHAVLGKGVYLEALSGCLDIGAYTCVGPYTCMAGPGDIHIGKNCMLASHIGIYANNHIFADINIPIGEQGIDYKGVVIEDDCWLGTGVKVLDGVTIGHGSVVGAGAVVTKNLPPFSVAVGVPAKVMYTRVGLSDISNCKFKNSRVETLDTSLSSSSIDGH